MILISIRSIVSPCALMASISTQHPDIVSQLKTVLIVHSEIIKLEHAHHLAPMEHMLIAQQRRVSLSAMVLITLTQ